MGLFEFLDNAINKTADGIKSGYALSERDLRNLSDKQLMDRIRRPDNSVQGIGKHKCYLDEARRRGLIKK